MFKVCPQESASAEGVQASRFCQVCYEPPPGRELPFARYLEAFFQKENAVAFFMFISDKTSAPIGART